VLSVCVRFYSSYIILYAPPVVHTVMPTTLLLFLLLVTLLAFQLPATSVDRTSGVSTQEGTTKQQQQHQHQQQQAPPTFPPAEQFCTHQTCLADGVATRLSPTASVHFNKYSIDRPHPQVVKFKGDQQQPEYVHAKFRSLSMRNLSMYWDDGKDGIYKGILQPGQTTQSNSYSGHRFFFTDEKDKNNVIGMVTIDKDKILNVIRDEERPLGADHPVMSQTLKEEAYDLEYMAKNDGLRCVTALASN
jgi:hypothetical protein